MLYFGGGCAAGTSLGLCDVVLKLGVQPGLAAGAEVAGGG